MDKARRPKLTDADRAAWTSYTSRIAPLPGGDRPVPRQNPEPAGVPPPRPQPQAAVRAAHEAASPLAVGDQPGGLDRATWQRFRAGKLRAERTLDLHGQTAQRAFHALAAFLRTARADRLRCVEVVTGRGTAGEGVIRREFRLWLNLPDIRPLVLAAAHPHAANPGSVRLLLRRAR